MFRFVLIMLWLSIVIVDGYSFDKYYNTSEFVTFYKSISQSSGKYNNIYLINKIFEGLDLYKNISKDCLDDLEIFRQSSVNSSDLWSQIMLDASGSFHSGMFQGNLHHLGDWRECFSVESPYFTTTSCQVKLTLPYGPIQNSSSPYHNVPIFFNLCLPSHCRNKDLEKLVSKSIQPRIDVKFECTSKQAHSYIAFMLIVAGVLSLLIGSTMYDLCNTENKRTLKFCYAFSVQRNWKVLFASSTTDKTLSCLYGIKFITQLMVIWYHVVRENLNLFQPITNKFLLAEVMDSWHGFYYFALTLSVDTYLVMSGLLVSYTSIGKKSKFSNLLHYYLHRYIRLTPSLLAVILFYLLAGNLICYGSQCSNTQKELTQCQNYWWTNLLYINNYYPSFKQSCLYQSWYLALDWQLYLISPVLLYLVSNTKNKRTIYAVLFLIFSLSFLMPSINTYFYSLPSDEFYLNEFDEMNNYYDKFYTPLETRFGPWIVGFILGIIIKFDETKFVQTNMCFKGTGWLMSGVLIGACLIINVPAFHIKNKNIFVNALYNALKKNLWGVTCGWFILACSKGYAGSVNTFLSWKPFELLSKLSYGAYLIHRAILGIYLYHTRTPLYYSVLNQVILLIGVVVTTYVVSLFLYLSIEAPFCNIDKLLLTGKTSTLKKENLNGVKLNHEFRQTGITTKINDNTFT